MLDPWGKRPLEDTGYHVELLTLFGQWRFMVSLPDRAPTVGELADVLTRRGLRLPPWPAGPASSQWEPDPSWRKSSAGRRGAG